MTLRVERVQGSWIDVGLGEGEGWGKKERHRRCDDDALLVLAGNGLFNGHFLQEFYWVYQVLNSGTRALLMMMRSGVGTARVSASLPMGQTEISLMARWATIY